MSAGTAREDLIPKPEIVRVFAENFAVYGVRKVWRQMVREGFVIEDAHRMHTLRCYASEAVDTG